MNQVVICEGLNMSTGEKVEKVKMFADEAHGEQMRKFAKERYIVHPIRVMEIVREYSQEVPLLAASLLHDVLEDTQVTPEQLKLFLDSVMNQAESDETFKLVTELTDVFTKTNYPNLNRRTRRTREAERLADVSSDAHTVKYADIIDNVLDISKHDTDFALPYMRESKQLLQHMTNGNPALYARALDVVNGAMQQYFQKANIKAL
ncbi:MAG TPA: HD domain-containing protein [Chryseosolibacter sp.]